MKTLIVSCSLLLGLLITKNVYGFSTENNGDTKTILAQFSECERGRSLPPSAEVRTIIVEKANLSLQVPENYDISKSDNDGKIYFYLHNPADKNHLECCNKNGIRGCGHTTRPMSISFTPSTKYSSLIPEPEWRNIFKQELRQIEKTTIAGKDAVLYILHNDDSVSGGEYLTREINFFSPNQQYVVNLQIMSPYIKTGNGQFDTVDERVFQQIANSFSFKS